MGNQGLGFQTLLLMRFATQGEGVGKKLGNCLMVGRTSLSILDLRVLCILQNIIVIVSQRILLA